MKKLFATAILCLSASTSLAFDRSFIPQDQLKDHAASTLAVLSEYPDPNVCYTHIKPAVEFATKKFMTGQNVPHHAFSAYLENYTTAGDDSMEWKFLFIGHFIELQALGVPADTTAKDVVVMSDKIATYFAMECLSLYNEQHLLSDEDFQTRIIEARDGQEEPE